MNITLLGVLFLGGFVGLIVGFVIKSTDKVGLKIAASVISAALAGTPVAFMKGLTFERWMYPIGLVLGLAWIRIISMRGNLNPNSKAHFFDWVDMIAIVGSTIVIISFTAFSKITNH